MILLLLAWGVGMGASDAGTPAVTASQLPTLGAGR